MWKADGEIKTLHLVRKLIMNTGNFMSGIKCKKEDGGEISLKYWKKKQTVNLENQWKQLLEVKTK